MQREGDVSVKGQEVIRGQVTGSVAVRQGGSLTLHGQICEDLVIETGAVAIVHGQVCGNVMNRGELILYGQVCGRVIGTPAALSRDDDP